MTPHEAKQRARFALGCLCLAWNTFACGLGLSTPIQDLRHSTWTSKEGAPAFIQSMAQASDGYLWIGSVNGLSRFDGLRFEQMPLPSDTRLISPSVLKVFPLASGGVWLGFTLGGAAFFRDGHSTIYSEQDGLPPGSVKAFAQGPDGTLWAGTSRGLARLTKSRWELIGADQHLPVTDTVGLMVDSDGRLWVATRAGIYSLEKGAAAFKQVFLISSVYPAHPDTALAESATGAIWMADGQHVRYIGRSKTSTGGSHSSGGRLLFDRDGALWVRDFSLEGPGMALRLNHPESFSTGASIPYAQIAASVQGVSFGTEQLIEDREGNIWLYGNLGIDRLAESKLRSMFSARGKRLPVEAGIAAADDGSIWLAAREGGVSLIGEDVTEPVPDIKDASCVVRAADSSIWFAGSTAIWRYASGRVATVPAPSGTEGSEVQAMAFDGAGDLWMSVVRRGVFKRVDGSWLPYGGLAALPREPAFTMATDRAGRVWLGYTDGTLAVVDGQELKLFDTSSGPNVGNVNALKAHAGGMWIGGARGLTEFDGATFRTLNGAGTELNGVSGIVETGDGDLWLNAATGILHITAAELKRGASNAMPPLQAEVFNALDGVDGTGTRVRPLPTAIQGTDGRLWFITSSGLYVIDPGHVYRNPDPPLVHVNVIRADGNELAPDAATTRLAANTKTLEIDYIGLSLTMPERIRYRYRLDGVDAQWQDARTRQRAFYANLKPGTYQFHVVASNNEGVWNETGASVRFSIPPTFIQTGWFLALCVLAGACTVWLMITLRVRQVALRMRGRLEERLEERERIARELHDTLLQSTQGLALHFQAAANRLRPDDPERAALNTALACADEVMEEGRNRVLDLRVPVDSLQELPQALAAAGEALASRHATKFHCVVEGRPRALQRQVRDESYRVGREALINAFRHGEAETIEVQIVYAESALHVRIRDDGVGIDAAALDAVSRAGHWGITGMQERARAIGAQLKFGSRPGAGTEIELQIPAVAAYRDTPLRMRWFKRLAARLRIG